MRARRHLSDRVGRCGGRGSGTPATLNEEAPEIVPSKTDAPTGVSSGVADRHRTERTAALLLLAHAVIAVTFTVWHPVHVEHEDVARFVQIASSPGLAYRDFGVEYAPLETALIDVGFDTTIGRAIPRAALISLLCDVSLFLVIRRAWGLRPATAYLLLTMPLQVFMPFRLDYVPVLLAVAAFAREKRGYQRSAGLLLGAAILFKIWPVVLVPVFLVRRRWHALGWCGLATVAGMLAWILIGGFDAVEYVSSFRGATGWQVESTIGSILAVGGSPLRIEAGAVRVGEIADWAPLLLRTVSLAVLGAVWWRARDGASDPAGFPAAAAVATAVALSPVSSSQYVAWLTPWTALAVEERPRPALLGAAMTASLLSAAAFVVYWRIDSATLLAWLALVRAAAIASIPVLWLRERALTRD